MPEWATGLGQLVLAGLTAIGAAELTRQWVVRWMERRAQRGVRLDSREEHDWGELVRFREEQAQRVDDLETDVRNLRGEIAQAHQDTAAARLETQEWRDRYFGVAQKLEAAQQKLEVTQGQLTAALAEIAAMKGVA